MEFQSLLGLLGFPHLVTRWQNFNHCFVCLTPNILVHFHLSIIQTLNTPLDIHYHNFSVCTVLVFLIFFTLILIFIFIFRSWNPVIIIYDSHSVLEFQRCYFLRADIYSVCLFISLGIGISIVFHFVITLGPCISNISCLPCILSNDCR